MISFPVRYSLPVTKKLPFAVDEMPSLEIEELPRVVAVTQREMRPTIPGPMPPGHAVMHEAPMQYFGEVTLAPAATLPGIETFLTPQPSSPPMTNPPLL